jgi:hypothetical protein|tara:strand:+ start:289 stop:582 length:294 start_codon:yes stop_codon:yes gene_type:complete
MYKLGKRYLNFKEAQPMSFTTILSTQNTFLETYLRGTNKTITAADAKARFGIQNLTARMSELRGAGLDVRVDTATTGKARYAMRARDIIGSRAKMFV